jgi:ubiquinol-cytochrome c reductase iron-sulfur subunit
MTDVSPDVDVRPDHGRRQFLVNSTAAVALVGISTTAVPFFSSCQPTAAKKLAGLPVQIDVSKLSIGEGIKILWRGMPMWIVRRSAEAVAQLDSLRDALKDPDSKESAQPEYAHNNMRARSAEVLVLSAVCTHLGCIPALKSAGEGNIDARMAGGFVCPCHDSKFDLAGRVMKGSPASINLPVPAHYFETENILVVGADAPEPEA